MKSNLPTARSAEWVASLGDELCNHVWMDDGDFFHSICVKCGRRIDLWNIREAAENTRETKFFIEYRERFLGKIEKHPIKGCFNTYL